MLFQHQTVGVGSVVGKDAKIKVCHQPCLAVAIVIVSDDIAAIVKCLRAR